MLWSIFTKSGNKILIPADSFVFWGELYEGILMSTIETTCVLWCFKESDICIGSSILDNDLWSTISKQGEISAQWRVVENGRLTLLKQMDKVHFPPIRHPNWMNLYLN